MSETCGTCGRPKGDYHRRPVAGECTAPDPTDYTVSIQCLRIALRNTQAALAAARREIEGLRKLLRTATVRIGILLDRMLGCDEQFKQGRRDKDGHALSHFEGAAWIKEQEAALAAPAAGEEG